MSLWGAIMGGANLVYHAAGWLESGLTASFEKLIVDAEMLQMMAEVLRPIEVNDDQLALDAIAGVDPAAIISARPTRSRTTSTPSTIPWSRPGRTSRTGRRPAASTRRAGRTPSGSRCWPSTSGRRWTRQSRRRSTTTSRAASWRSRQRLTGPTRALLADAARRGADYLEALDHRPVYPREADIDRLRVALRERLARCGRRHGRRGARLPGRVRVARDRRFGRRPLVRLRHGRRAAGGTRGRTCSRSAWDQDRASASSTRPPRRFSARRLAALARRTSSACRRNRASRFVLGASAANFAGLAAAGTPYSSAPAGMSKEQGLRGSPEVAVVVGEEAHGTISRRLPLLGFGRRTFIACPRTRRDACVRTACRHRRADDRLHPGRQRELRRLRSGAEIVAVGPSAAPGCTWMALSGCGPRPRTGYGRSWPGRARRLLGDRCAQVAQRAVRLRHRVRARRGRVARRHVGQRRLPLIGGQDPIDLTSDGSRRARGFDVWAALQLARAARACRTHRPQLQPGRLAGRRTATRGHRVLNEVVLNQVVVAFGSDAGPRRRHRARSRKPATAGAGHALARPRSDAHQRQQLGNDASGPRADPADYRGRGSSTLMQTASSGSTRFHCACAIFPEMWLSRIAESASSW